MTLLYMQEDTGQLQESSLVYEEELSALDKARGEREGIYP